MKLIRNLGADRVVDELRKSPTGDTTIDVATPLFSLAAFAELRGLLESVASTRLTLPGAPDRDLRLLGSDADRAFRNRLTVRWLARKCAEWVKSRVQVREAPVGVPQSMFVVGHPEPQHRRVICGNCPFTSNGLGLAAGFVIAGRRPAGVTDVRELAAALERVVHEAECSALLIDNADVQTVPFRQVKKESLHIVCVRGIHLHPRCRST
jgi:hypothetical protein